jgi:hypothetical protein
VKVLGVGLLAVLAIGAFFKGAIAKSQIDNAEQKFIFDFGGLQVHSVSFSGIVLAITGFKIYNQSSLSATISNLYVNPKYNDGTSLQSLLIQDNFLQPFTIAANSATTLPTLLFKLSLTNLPVLYDIYKGKLSSLLSINVRFQVLGGYEINIDQQQSIAPFVNTLKSLFNNPFVVGLLGGGASVQTPANNNAANNNAANNNAANNNAANNPFVNFQNLFSA